MEKYNGYPLYELTMDDDALGIYAISLTSNPATKVAWFAFSNQEETIKCSIIDDGYEHKILTPIARANYPILRIDDKGNKFYVTFSKETINKMAQKFLKEGFQGQINIEHEENSFIDGVELVELFIKDTEKGINPKGFEQVEEGSLFGIYKIENDRVWDAILKGYFKSVSLEGIFHVKEDSVISTIEELLDYLSKS